VGRRTIIIIRIRIRIRINIITTKPTTTQKKVVVVHTMPCITEGGHHQ